MPIRHGSRASITNFYPFMPETQEHIIDSEGPPPEPSGSRASAADTQDLRTASSALAALEHELANLKKATDHIQESKEAAQQAVDAYRRLHEQSKGLVEPVENLIERIDAVHFPSRFDKLDASMTGVNSALQNVQGQIREFASGVSTRMDETEAAVDDVATEVKTVRTFVLVAILFLVIIGGLVILL